MTRMAALLVATMTGGTMLAAGALASTHAWTSTAAVRGVIQATPAGVERGNAVRRDRENRGGAVSAAVHAAQTATTPGRARGEAVSAAASALRPATVGTSAAAPGATVAQAVHQAISSTASGEERGDAVAAAAGGQAR